MKRLTPIIAALMLTACATPEPPPLSYPAALCPRLPDPPHIATRLQLEAYTTQVVRLYGVCANLQQ